MRMATITVHRAKTTLSRLIERALAGEEIIIARGAVPAVRLVPVAVPKPRRHFGAMRGRARTTEAFFAQLTTDELSHWTGRLPFFNTGPHECLMDADSPRTALQGGMSPTDQYAL